MAKCPITIIPSPIQHRDCSYVCALHIHAESVLAYNQDCVKMDAHGHITDIQIILHYQGALQILVTLSSTFQNQRILDPSVSEQQLVSNAQCLISNKIKGLSTRMSLQQGCLLLFRHAHNLSVFKQELSFVHLNNFYDALNSWVLNKLVKSNESVKFCIGHTMRSPWSCSSWT